MEAILLVGIQAAGKSTFFQTYFAGTHVRVNLDALKTRGREDRLLEACLASRQSFVVDNTNVLARERAIYIALARPKGYRIIGYYFQASVKEALKRNAQRTGKERIPEKGVLAKYRLLEPPRYEEGFDELYAVTVTEHGGFRVAALPRE